MPYNEPTNQTPEETSHLLTQLLRLDSAIDKEFTLVSERMTWLVVSESFIFNAFTAAVANYKPDHKMATALLFLIWILPFVGFLLATLVYPAILAAHSAAKKLKDLRDDVFNEKIPSELKVEVISSKSGQHIWGNVPPYVIPPAFILVWLVIIILLLVLSSKGGFA